MPGYKTKTIIWDDQYHVLNTGWCLLVGRLLNTQSDHLEKIRILLGYTNNITEGNYWVGIHQSPKDINRDACQINTPLGKTCCDRVRTKSVQNLKNIYRSTHIFYLETTESNIMKICWGRYCCGLKECRVE